MHRAVRATLTLVVAAAVATGCAADPVPATRVAAYELLAAEMASLFSAAQHFRGNPGQVVELERALSYDFFAEGVELTDYSPDEKRMCLTGPENTFLALTNPADSEVSLLHPRAGESDGLRRIFGVGPCDYEEGEVVIDVYLPEGATDGCAREVAVAGAYLATQIPALEDFLGIVNQNSVMTENNSLGRARIARARCRA